MEYVILFFVGLAIFGFIQGRMMASKQKTALAALARAPHIEAKDHLVAIDGSVAIGLDHGRRAVSIALMKHDRIIITSFADIIEVAKKENGSSTNQVNKGSLIGGALVGAVVAGGVGAVVGALGAGGTTRAADRLNQLSLNLVISNLQHPSIEILLFSEGAKGAKRGGMRTSGPIAQADRWYATLTACMKIAANSQDRPWWILYKASNLEELARYEQPAPVVPRTDAATNVDLADLTTARDGSAQTHLASDLAALDRLVRSGVLTAEEAQEKALKLVQKTSFGQATPTA